MHSIWTHNSYYLSIIVSFFLSNLRRNICDKVDIWGKNTTETSITSSKLLKCNLCTKVSVVLGVSVWGRGKLAATPERSSVCCVVSSVISSLSACERCVRLWSCVYFLSDWVTGISKQMHFTLNDKWMWACGSKLQICPVTPQYWKIQFGNVAMFDSILFKKKIVLKMKVKWQMIQTFLKAFPNNDTQTSHHLITYSIYSWCTSLFVLRMIKNIKVKFLDWSASAF